MLQSNAELQKFVLAYFTALGADPRKAGAGVWRVELSPEQKTELEGSSMPYLAPASERSVLYFTFDRAAAAADQEVELIAPGSRRLEQICSSLRRNGRVTQLQLLARGRALFRPTLLLHLRAERRGGGLVESLHAVWIDLVDGRHKLWDASGRLPAFPFQEGKPSENRCLRRAVRFRVALEIACELVKQRIADDPETWTWVRRQSRGREDERIKLMEAFPKERTGEIEDRLDRRLQEADERLKPRLTLQPALAALIWTPGGYAASGAWVGQYAIFD